MRADFEGCTPCDLLIGRANKSRVFCLIAAFSVKIVHLTARAASYGGIRIIAVLLLGIAKAGETARTFGSSFVGTGSCYLGLGEHHLDLGHGLGKGGAVVIYNSRLGCLSCTDHLILNSLYYPKFNRELMGFWGFGVLGFWWCLEID